MVVCRAVGTGLVLMAVAGCAARGVPAQVQADVRAADALVAEGCYTCLRDAVAIYDRLSTVRRAPPGLAERSFEAEILLTLRAKEIGMPFTPWLERARGHADALPDSSGAGVAVELADLMAEETSGLAPGAPRRSRFRQEVAPALDAWRARVGGSGLSAVLKQYLDLALACTDRGARDAVLAGDTAGGPGALLRYRRAICTPTPDADVGRLLAADPRWGEAAWFEGRRVLASTGDVPAAIRLFEQSAEAFPQSGAMLMSLAGAQRAARDLDAALATYDAVLQLVPDHRDALLGRVLCLTYLERHQEAIAASTRLIDLGTYLMADAYYWRAWNGYQVKALDAAWNDVTEALALQTNTNVHTLAGLVAYARRDRDTALTHFDTAVSIDGENCNAAFYKGVVLAERRAWSDAAPTFDAAMTCFTSVAAAARAELEALRASSQPDTFKAKQGAEHEATIAQSDRQAALAAYNAAQAFANMGQTALALSHLDRATHDTIREKAEALRRRIAPPPGRS